MKHLAIVAFLTMGLIPDCLAQVPNTYNFNIKEPTSKFYVVLKNDSILQGKGSIEFRKKKHVLVLKVKKVKEDVELTPD